MTFVKFKFAKSSFVCMLLLILSGCSAITGHQEDIDIYTKDFTQTNCDVNLQKTKIEKNNDVILAANQAGSLIRQCKDFNASTAYFDIAEDRYKSDVDEEGVASQAAGVLGTALVNDNVLDYEGFYYERVMTNVYKALNFMSLGDYDNARIELNRAIDRQRRAKDAYAKELQKASDEVKKGSGVTDKQQSAQNESQISAILKDYEGSLGEFSVLPNFINPFVSYLYGIFSYAQKDYAKSRDLLKESLLMNDKNPQIQKDFKLAEEHYSHVKKKKNSSKYIWIIYENGMTINRQELRYDIPLFILTSHVPHVGIALPKLGQSQSSFDSIKANGEQSIVVADMDAVVRSEFKNQMPLIVTKAVARAATKAALGYAAKEGAGDFGALGAGLYSLLTNKADLRYWSTLPQNFQSLRVENDGQEIKIMTDTGVTVGNLLPKKDLNGIIYVKSLTPQNLSLYEIYFKEN